MQQTYQHCSSNYFIKIMVTLFPNPMANQYFLVTDKVKVTMSFEIVQPRVANLLSNIASPEVNVPLD